MVFFHSRLLEVSSQFFAAQGAQIFKLGLTMEFTCIVAM